MRPWQATNGTKITLNATQLYAVLDAMEQDEEQVPDIREQMFHNTVREHIVSTTGRGMGGYKSGFYLF